MVILDTRWEWDSVEMKGIWTRTGVTACLVGTLGDSSWNAKGDPGRRSTSRSRWAGRSLASFRRVANYGRLKIPDQTTGMKSNQIRRSISTRALQRREAGDSPPEWAPPPASTSRWAAAPVSRFSATLRLKTSFHTHTSFSVPSRHTLARLSTSCARRETD